MAVHLLTQLELEGGEVFNVNCWEKATASLVTVVQF